ncbi:MAG TPA: aminotransferase class I/II-fold pyridoxal phosphate-dependent enzyme [Candidatus Polarisedimenticolia bacterium]|nr:aminotransferase class I/II-fold pyridoxal phosphate-dependent enzyme [Candidatus Polarisedimenticolia bacterium]
MSLDLPGRTMRAVTEQCTRFAIRQIETLPEQPSWDLEGVAEVAAGFREPPPESGAPIESLLEKLGRAVPKSLNAAGPGYMAYIPGGGIYPAALGDYLALSVNRFVGIWNAAPALVEIEATVIDWLRHLVGYPAGAAGLLTTGGSMSNLIALVTARRDRLPENFLDGVLYMSEQTHHSLAKAAALAGFPERSVRELPVDERFRLRIDALETAIAADRTRGLKPFLVVANAGTTNTGAIDPLPEIADLCVRHGLWLHVDAAYGGFFRLAPGGESLLPGLERADSLTLDPHKGLFLPYGTGCLLVRDAATLARAHRMRAGYLQDLQHPPDAINFADLSPELSREFRGLRLWLPLTLFGVAAFRDNLREKLELARWAYEELRSEPGCECLDPPQLSIVAFRYRPPAGESADAFNARLLRRVNDRRRVYLSSTTLRGRYALRLCILSFRTHGRDVARALEDIRSAAREEGGVTR